MSVALQVKKYIKSGMLFLEKIIPQSIFHKVIEGLLPVYKRTVRSIYLLKSTLYLLKRDKEGWRMARRIHQIMPSSLVGTGGLEATYKLAKMMNEHGREGNFVELGVARGGCAALIAMVAFDDNPKIERQVWLFDSFEGLPEPTDSDYAYSHKHCTTGYHVRPLPKGSCLGPLEQVQDLLLNKFKFPGEKVIFVEGWFENTLPVRGKDLGKIALLRIDADWYEPTKTCLNHLYDQVVQGGAVIIDDYHSCFGCKKAVDEFLEQRQLWHIELTFDGRGGCYFLKP